MTALLGPSRGNTLLREGPWQYGFDTLEAAGVRLSDEQISVFTADSPDLVMVVWPLPDPRDWRYEDELPDRVFEPGGHRYAVPVLAEVDWLGWGELEMWGSEAWRRFPSVPIRLQIASYNDMEMLDTGVRYARAWDIDVIPDTMWGAADQAFENIWLNSDYAALRDLSFVTNGSHEDCWLASKYLGPVEAHHHEPEAHAPHLWRCIDGEDVASKLHESFYDDDGAVYSIEIPLEISDAKLEERWSTLTNISKSAAEQALLAAPPWLREDLRAAELKGGRPWD